MLHSTLLFSTKLAKHIIYSLFISLKVYDEVIKQGIQKSRRENWECPLMYDWHDKVYLGAAHGVIGILYILMQVTTSSSSTIE